MENTIVGLFFESCALRNSVTTQTQEAAERERLFNSIETVPGNVPAVKKADWAVGTQVERQRQSVTCREGGPHLWKVG